MLLSSTSHAKYCCFPFLYVSREMSLYTKSPQLKNLSEIHMVACFAFHSSSVCWCNDLLLFLKNQTYVFHEKYMPLAALLLFFLHMLVKNLFAIPRQKLRKQIFLCLFSHTLRNIIISILWFKVTPDKKALSCQDALSTDLLKCPRKTNSNLDMPLKSIPCGLFRDNFLQISSLISFGVAVK